MGVIFGSVFLIFNSPNMCFFKEIVLIYVNNYTLVQFSSQRNSLVRKGVFQLVYKEQ